MCLESGSRAAAFFICGCPLTAHDLFSRLRRTHSINPHFAQFWCNITPFRINTCELSRKYCEQTTYRIAKSFRCNTYKKQGGGYGVLLWLRPALLLRYLKYYLNPIRSILVSCCRDNTCAAA